FISAEGHLMPCCFFGSYIHQGKLTTFPIAQIHDFIDDYGLNRLKIPEHSIEEIMNLDFLESIEKSWMAKNINDGKLIGCNEMCGSNKGHFTNLMNESKSND